MTKVLCAGALVLLYGATPQALRPAFDIGRFHEAVLGSGSMPLSVLERHIDWFIAQEKARKK